MSSKKVTRQKRYFGIRYLGGNRNSTIGDPSKSTGMKSIVCTIAVFSSKAELEEWLSKEDVAKSAGQDGGERIAATKSECRNHCLGQTTAEFEKSLRTAFLLKREISPLTTDQINAFFFLKMMKELLPPKKRMR